MELTYRLTRDDYRQYVKQVQARVVSPVPASASAWKQAVAALPVLVALLLTLAVLTGVTASGLIDGRAYAAACAAYVWGLASVEIVRSVARRRLATWLPDDSTFRDTRLTVDGDGVVGSDSVSTSRYSWRAFSDVTEQAGLILLWIDRGAKCLIVPARALADDAARRDFVTLAREGIAQAAAA